MMKPISTLFFFFIFFLSTGHASAQVVAGFTVADTFGCAPFVDFFTNTSTGATTYTWDLGNGTTSTLTDVSGSYVTPGTYTVTLTAHNGALSNTYHTTINVYASPTVNFHASDTTVCPGVPAVFTSTSIAGAPGPVTYTWNFGDGSSSTAVAPSHAYLSSGDYNTTLFITNGKGCISSLSKDPYMHVYAPPFASFTALSTHVCKYPGNITFSNGSTGAGPLSYIWRFGDGYTSTSASPTHHYTPGIYDVSLTATDVHGCVDSMYNPGYVSVGALSAAFTPVANGCLNTPVTFTNTSSAHVLSGWDFGDGGTALTEDGVHTYTLAGTYSVRLVIYDGTCFDTVFHPITITHPTGSFTMSPLHPCSPPATLTFTASVPPGATVSWYSLDFGPLGTGSVLSHTFPYYVVHPVPGISDSVGFIDSITMVVTDTHGCADSVGRIDTVNNLKLTASPINRDTCSPVTANFSAQLTSFVYDPFAGYPWYVFSFPPPLILSYPYPYAVSTYSWNFGDGSPTSSAPTPSHVYTTVGGVYTYSVTITTVNGCTQSFTDVNAIAVGSPPPTPTFTLTPTHICAGRSISFAATGSGTFDRYGWNFGNGDVTVTSFPATVDTYKVPGIYKVKLSTLYHGCPSPPDSLYDTVFAPNAVAIITPSCLIKTQARIVDSSHGDDSHLWQFGDGTTSTASVVIHNYPAIDTYTLTLTTYNIASGCRDTIHTIVDLTPMQDTVFAFHKPVCRDIADTFVAIAMPNLTGNTYVSKYQWYFGGVLTDSLVSGYSYDTIRRHAFHITGVNTPVLVLTDNHGCLDTLSVPVIVAKPVDTFSHAPASGCAPLLVTFTDHSVSTPGTTLAHYFWSFGNGDTATSVTPSITHSYSLAGSYIITETVTDNAGCADTFTSHIAEVVNKPTASFSAVVPTICNHNSVTFINTSPSFTSCLWYFGDGDTSTAVAPTHMYSVAGIYTPMLIVTGTGGCKDTMTIPNYIVVNPTPVASFTLSDSFAVCSPFNVNFTNTSTGATIYYWTFGDGTSSSTPDPSDVYVTPGYYRVKLQVYNAYACTDTAIAHVNLFGYSGAFSYTPDNGCPAMPVHFRGTFTTVARVIWDFADGSTSPSSADTITHVYTSLGTFVPKLILTDSFGCISSSIGIDTIKLGNLVAGFTITPNPVCAGNTITFTDTSSGGVSPIATRLWTFAPGVTSTLPSPTHTYTAAGTYPVTLTVTNTSGCSGTVTQNVVVNSVPPPIVGPSIVCIGAATTFTDAVSGGIWSSSAPAVAAIGSISGAITTGSTGVATITYSLGSGCTVTKPITVDAVSSVITGPGQVCIGANITLADTAHSGRWSSSAPGIAIVGSTSGIVTGVAGGVDTIIYTTLAVCPARKTVTVNPSPAITAPGSVCVGATASLTATPAGGTWSSGTPAIATIGSSSGVITGVSYGAAHITYVAPVTGCTATATVFINHVPSAITGGGFVCLGGSSALTDTVPGGIWSSSNTLVATVGSTSGIVAGISTGMATISYNIGGCLATTIVTVSPLPAISGPGMVCAGDTIVLTDPTPGGIWASSDPLIAAVGSSTGRVAGMVMGSATITYSLGGGCVAWTPVSVEPAPAAITGPPAICLGATATLHDTTAGGVWSSSNSAIVTVGSTGHIVGVSGGVATISYMIPTGCSARLQETIDAVPPITGLTNLCAWSDTIIVHDIDTAGSYSSTLAVVINLGSGAGKFYAAAPGMATISYTTPLGCVTTDTITVKTLPGAITGVTDICLGGTTTLHDTTAGGLWSSSGGAVSVGSSSGVVAGLALGTSDVTYTAPVTGCKVSTPVDVVAFPSAGSISGPSILCVGQVITVIDTTTGGSWSSHFGHASVSGGVVSGTSAGSDTIMYAVANVCGTAIAKHPVTVYPTAIAGAITGPDSVCVSSNITLADTAAGGVWSMTNANASVLSGVVTGLSQGRDTAVYLIVNPACSDTTTFPIIINPLPVAGTITGSSVLCVGDSALLIESASGGAWSHSNAVATLDTISGAGIEYRSVSVGTDTVFYTVTNVCGTIAANHLMDIGTTPVIDSIHGANVLCEGQTITLTDAIAGGLWSGTDVAVATIGSSSGVVTGITMGKDTITYTITNACGSVNTTMPITVNPLPVVGDITGNSTLCVGDTATLTDSITGGTWGVSSPAVSLTGSAFVTAVSGGLDTLSYSVTNSCGTAVATQVITIDTLPNNVVITDNDHLLSVPAGYKSYQWFMDGQPVSGATSNTYLANGTGIYTVLIGNKLGCMYTTPPAYVIGCRTTDIEVYPNPVASIIYIQWCSPVTVRLNCIDGKLIQIIENTSQVDVSFLPNGIYSMTVFDSKGQKLLTRRITKLAP